jgi:hypothetical protein
MEAAMALEPRGPGRARPSRDEHERSESVETSRMKIVYAACERGGRLSRIGVAFIDADGALNVKLEALPVSGELRIVDYAPAGGAPGATAARASREPNARA